MNIREISIGNIYIYNGTKVKVLDIDTITKNVYITSIGDMKRDGWEKISQWVHVRNLE